MNTSTHLSLSITELAVKAYMFISIVWSKGAEL